MQPPPQSGLPFNGQLHESDIERGYSVPNPYPRPLPPELESQVDSNPELKSIKETYEDFVGVVRRSTVKVIIPQDRSLLDRIHKTIEYVIREGPVFESIIMAREGKNPAYSFLYDNQSQEHVYYRWKLYSILHGDDPYEWRTDEFRMFDGGPIWRPPPLNPFADGMPLELIEKTTGLSKDVITAGGDNSIIRSKMRPLFSEGSLIDQFNVKDSRTKGTLGLAKREVLGDLLRNLDPTKAKIGSAMMFCIDHADAAQEIIDCIYESLLLLETPFQRKVARLFLISDILHNCSAAVTNASFYRKGFQAKLESIFEHLREYLVNIEDRYKADKFKQKTLGVLGAWKEWTLYEDEFVIQLSNILLGIKPDTKKQHSDTSQHAHPQQQQQQEQQQQLHADAVCQPNADIQTTHLQATKRTGESDLDGEPLDEDVLARCLEVKGLSLRWYKTLELSDDEEADSDQCEADRNRNRATASRSSPLASQQSGSASKEIKFKASKWETVDPNEVAEQVVTLSKWELLAKEKSPNSDGTTTSCELDDELCTGRVGPSSKRFKRTTTSSDSSGGETCTD